MRTAELADETPHRLALGGLGEVKLTRLGRRVIVGFALSINCRFSAVHRGALYSLHLISLIGVREPGPASGRLPNAFDYPSRLLNVFDYPSLMVLELGSADQHLSIDDICLLTLDERVDFIAGCARLSRHLRPDGGGCLCHFPAFVTLPIAAFATLVAAGHPGRSSAYTDLVSIGYVCADKIGLKDKLLYEKFLRNLVARDRESVDGMDLEHLEKRAAACILESYGIRLSVGDRAPGPS